MEREREADSESALVRRVLQRRKVADSLRRFGGSTTSSLSSPAHSAITAPQC